MKHVGIIGGIGPEATMDYYRAIIAGVQQVKHSTAVLPEISIRSIDMYRMFSMLDREDYPAVEAYLGDAAEDLRHGGADFGLMCGNTPHIVFDGIQRRTALPLLSIVTSALQEAQRRGLHRLGLLGTKFTMHHDFFTSAFQAAGIAMVTPEGPTRSSSMPVSWTSWSKASCATRHGRCCWVSSPAWSPNMGWTASCSGAPNSR
ncbi:aspartate/glutamate racemase family protein [Bifidobacterium mongoliense]|jgi:aspartate racemase|uniref:aspartate/glutamate racemase family protein n=1 Tax=Bifidobacterium mongoliense TaxID=518643 RepID=UPI00264A2A62|nr:amino acid racemase [Bifidobacterium mongoliense]MDN5978710.1 amino acid racemase [Bifidobacterium mongoliense]